MKKTKSTLFKSAFLLLGVVLLFAISACEKKEDPVVEDPIASFQFTIDENDFLKVTFQNFSLNAETYRWDFGDNQTSTEMNPIHTFAEPGNYIVVLTATNSAGVSVSFSETIEIKNPLEALERLTGQISKTWRLYRVGNSLGVGPNIDNRFQWWSLQNDGSRPCKYFHEFTFHKNGTFVFNDKGSMWGEGGVFRPDLVGTCFEAVAANMVGPGGENLSAWLGGTHSFTYEPTTNRITLNGLGAWIGLVKLGTLQEFTTPQSSVSFSATIEERIGYDLMTLTFQYETLVWSFLYASYSNPALEPAVVTDEPPAFGVDLPDITPTSMFITFAAKDAANMATIDTVFSGSTVVFGVPDPITPANPAVGQFNRTAGVQWQELQFRTTPVLNDIQFTNFSTVSIDILIPAATEFVTDGLQRTFTFGFADRSATQEWWTSPVQIVTSGDNVIVGAWHTYTFDLTNAKARNDLDMIFLGIGGGGHNAGGTFFVRNLRFNP